MPSLFDPINENAKIVLVGDQGHGKTGSLASLVPAGYKLRILDTDNGSRGLRSLLTHPEYPYAEAMRKFGIDPTESGRISCITVSVPMELKTTRLPGSRDTFSLLSPSNSKAWTQIASSLSEWRDGDINLGPITDWDNDTVLVLDTLSTAAEIAKYWYQDINNRLGTLEDPHGHDTGIAQEMIKRLARMLTDPSVKCNVIAVTHITWTDTSRGAAQNPSVLIRDGRNPDIRGYPAIIGQALSPVFGKYWNDVFIVKRTGDSAQAERKIYSVPTGNVDAKHSAYVESSYPISTGLAEIFAALRYQPAPTELINAIRGKDNPNSPSDPNNTGPTPGFGSVDGRPRFGSRK